VRAKELMIVYWISLINRKGLLKGRKEKIFLLVAADSLIFILLISESVAKN
jgi:hypothetical protein